MCLLSLHDNEGTSFHQNYPIMNSTSMFSAYALAYLEKNLDVVKKFRFTNSGTKYFAQGGPEYSRMLHKTKFVLLNYNCNNRLTEKGIRVTQ